jgi:hypothetical protein
MAQSDQQVQNATFPAVRADINDNLAALFSQSSGPSAPTVTVAWQPWIDTSATPAVWKVRNAANTGWLTVGTFDTAFQPAGLTAIANGGTGQTTATGAINALLPSQTGNSGKYLTTNGTAAGWEVPVGSVVYEYTANNTWTKPSFGSFALVTIWGGGGSGGRNAYATGGGGGACVQRLYRLSELPSSVAITIGAGGAGRSGNGDGNTGGTTTFGSLLSAYGGAGGDATDNSSTATTLRGGGGGGSLGAGSSATGGNGHGPSLIGADGAGHSIAVGKGDFGGGGGGASINNQNGGTAYWGGGGGGGRDSGSSKSGGVSLHGGNGSASNQNAVGGFPGGGSGATDGVTGAGGAGYCLIYVW